ncbi:MAG: thioredoxin domain-containing protein, partial [Anaerolineae bacterium]
MPNRLIDETSPYLLQHAHNPVDWFPWTREALEKADAEDKPIFLSIGYSACHWCHVMERESFEDEATAQILNEHFVSIKVDREERPDLDRIYMGAVQALTGSGGWPMSVFLTPDGKPFYGGTYFPPAPRFGMPSFRQVLRTVADAWENRREELLRASERVVRSIERQMASGPAGQALQGTTLWRAFQNLRRDFDEVHGGWGAAPKFPQPMVLEFLLRQHHLTEQAEALRMVTKTLEAMARGGMYDQLGGGFHRYSVDDHWLVPHFEKMLYDNSQLARVYLHAWQVTGNQFFRTITEEILDYVMREMTDPAGGFYSTQDADSGGGEGKFFVWTPDEIREVLGPEADELMAAYGVTPQGNFEGKNIFEFVGAMDQRAALAQARRKLFEAREKRVHPGRDEKVLTSWNGLMLAAFAEAARILDREDYREVAERNANFLLRGLRQENGRLLRTWKARPEQAEGAGEAKLNGYLEDYAYLIEGLLQLYQTTFEPRWFIAAQELAETMLTHFQASDGVQLRPEPQLPTNSASLGGGIVGFFDTSDDHERLITRPRDLQDNATPSGNAMAVTALLELAGFTHDARYLDIAHGALAQME